MDKGKKKYRISDTQIQMAREFGMNSKKFGSLANYKQEKWKAPLHNFIEVTLMTCNLSLGFLSK